MTQQNFGEILKGLRKKSRMTQDELAKKINVAKSTVSMYERGERFPSFDIVQSIADVFHVNIDILYGRQPKHRNIFDYIDATNQIDLNLQLFAETPEKEKAPLGSRREEQAPPLLTPEEVQVVLSYRTHPELQPVVRKLLDIPEGTEKDTDVVS